MEEKVLITIPDLAWKGGGGVTEIYRSIALNENSNYFYFVVRPANIRFRFLQLLGMYLRFIRKIRSYDIVHINPSLNFNAIVRDGLLVLLSKLFGKKTIVYIHGWREDFELKIHKYYLANKLFKFAFSRVDAFILLGKVFQDKLTLLLNGTKAKFYIIPTIADNTFVKGMDICAFRKHAYLNRNTFTLLFLSRLVPRKGLEIVLQVQQLLERNSSNFKTIIAGDGELKNWAMQRAKEMEIKNIQFVGYVKDFQKHEVFLEADALFFPSHSEGLPCSVLESMLYGLPIITRKVGGIPEWVKDPENGIISESSSSEYYSNAIFELATSKESLIRISELNNKTANSNFTNDIIRERILAIYKEVQDFNG